MARKNAPYTPEFRHQMIELVRSGRSPESLSKEFEPTAQAIRNWVAQAERDAGRRNDGVTTAERDEINRLRREVRQLKLERDILSKAAAWFARETDVIPPKGSDSLARTRPTFRLPPCAECWAFRAAGTMRGEHVRPPGGRARIPR
jgi:transposase